jgi:retron-type reverse transcriptase
MVLESICEPDFLDCSYGFRPGRSAHQALEAVWRQTMGMGGGWVWDVDVRKFFDTIDHGHLRDFLKRRIRDGVLLRLIGKWLKAGVLEDGCLTHPATGSPQGGVITLPYNVAKSSLIPDSVISRTRLRPKYGQGWQPRLDPLPRQAEGRDLGEKESS